MKKNQDKQAPSDHENDESRSTLSIFAKVGYGFGHVLNDLCATVWFSYTLLFLKDVLNMPSEAGSCIMLGQITDAIFSAIAGYMTDRFGTKRNWHIIGTVVVILSFPAIYLMQRDALPYWGFLFYLNTFITIFQCGWAIVQISHLSILPELSTTQKDRLDMNSVRYSLSILANITVFLVAWMVLQVTSRESNGIGGKDFFKFRDITLSLTAVGAVFTILFQLSLTSSNYDERRKEKKELQKTGDKSLNVKILTVLQNPDLYKIAMLYTFSRLFLVICIMYIPVWLNVFIKTNSAIKTEDIAIIPLIFYVASFVAAFLLKYINQKISHKIVYCAGSLISISGCVWITFSSTFQAIELIGIAILLGAGSSVTQISSLCITADLIGDKSQHGGMIYSIITLCDKLFSGIIILIISQFQSGQDEIKYFTNVLSFNGITALLGMMVLGTFVNRKKLPKKILEK